jgi:Flp pilus assembly pilin Flp
MKITTLKVQRFLAADLGSIAVKFAVILALVAIVAVTAYASVETSVSPGF